MDKREAECLAAPLQFIASCVFPDGIIITKINRTLLEEEVKYHRNRECSNLGGCLVFADCRKFNSFSCKFCPSFKK